VLVLGPDDRPSLLTPPPSTASQTSAAHTTAQTGWGRRRGRHLPHRWWSAGG
jgi:hypothetical protein